MIWLTLKKDHPGFCSKKELSKVRLGKVKSKIKRHDRELLE